MNKLLAATVLSLTFIAGQQASIGDTNEASKAYTAAMDKMHQSMSKDMTGDADMDFAMMMVPHHQGAIDMAKIELQYGKDAMLRKMAQKIVKDQNKEIDQLQSWLSKHSQQHNQ